MISAATRLPPASGRPPAALLAVCGWLLLLVAGFCMMLWPQWRHNPDLSHGFFAPLVFFLLLGESRRQGTPRWLPVARWPGLAPGAILVVAIVLFAFAGLFAASLAWTHAVVLVLLAATLGCFLLAGLILLAGESVRLIPFNWISLTALLLWILVAPLPDGTYARLTLGLQHWVTGSVMTTLHLLGIPARQHGNIIELARTTVGVAEACSGIRSLISCVYAGFFFAAWQVRHPLGRLVLIFAAPVLALGMNFLRSLTLTLLANAGTDINGFWHDATGFGILAVTAVLLAALAMLLEGPPRPVAVPGPPAGSPPRRALGVFWTGTAAVLGLALFYLAHTRPAHQPDRPVPDLAALLPTEFEGWQVETAKELYQFADILQTTHLLERTYHRTTRAGRQDELTVYIAYWTPGQTSVSRVASHTPDACWPGAGWNARPEASPKMALRFPHGITTPGEHRIFQNETGYAQQVWFWHIYDGRSIDYRDPYSLPALLAIALQYGFQRPGDQFFVRISSNREWSDLAQEPLVQEIGTKLTSLGL
jgi:exosortase